MFNNSKKIIILNTLAIIAFLFLPYYIFEGKLFIGGDDTRLFYIYPLEWIKNIAYFSWFNFSSLGTNNPNQFIIPTLLPLILLKNIISNDLTLNYLVISFAFISGFLSFQFLISELVPLRNDTMRSIVLLGSLFYVLSPILVVIHISAFLYSVWLMSLMPLITYFFIRFLKTNDIKNILLGVVFCGIFSISMFSTPWILGYLLPLFIGLLFSSFLFSKTERSKFIRKFFIFFGVVFVSQAFWVLSLLLSFLGFDKSSFSSQAIIGGNPLESFNTTVISTATGNILFPLLDLFHKQIAIDFEWNLRHIFSFFYDKIVLLNTFFIFIFIFGLFVYKKVLNFSERRIFVIFLIAFISSLFFFTVNIGFLKYIFLFFGYIPGFIMFRNFYDKFDLSYILLYSVVLTFCLLVINKYLKKRILLVFINCLFVFIVFVNVLPIKNLVNSPIWTTKNVYSNISMPIEYLEFQKEIKSKIPYTSNILSLPLNIASYTIIKEDNSSNSFIGRSPVQLFSGVNDLSGDFSFSAQDTDLLNNFIRNKKYFEISEFLQTHNINYIFITKNIPDSLRKSYLFDPLLLLNQDDVLIDSITGEKILESTNGNYLLYSTKVFSPVLQSKDIFFQKISPVKYKIYVKNLKELRTLLFLDSFSPGWNLFLEKDPQMNWCNEYKYSPKNNLIECKAKKEYFDIEDLLYSFKSPIFSQSHKPIYSYANSWQIDSKIIKSKYNKDYFLVNGDGSMDIELILYFEPQNYFYIGTIISALTIFALIGLILRNKK